MLISVIIPAFNEEKYIGHTLDQLFQSISENEKQGISWEIIICDNNSLDKTAEIARKKGAEIIFEPINQISRARNKGTEIAKGEWFLFLDADSYPPPALLSDVIDLIQEEQHIGCGSTIKIEEGTFFNKLRMERLNPLFRFFNVSGGLFILCQGEAFRAIDGFSHGLYALEEFDFIHRLKKYGKKKDKKFTVLFKNPVITSGRKGEYKVSSIFVLFFSQIAAILLFILYYILPGKMMRRINTRFLGYWYKGKR